MSCCSLACSTGDPQADEVLRTLVVRLEPTFPGRISGYFLEGSYADGTAVATSDVDVTIVFDAPPTTDERDSLLRVLQEIRQAGALELDVTVIDEQQLRRQCDPIFQLGSRLLYGRDIRRTLSPIPIADWARQRMHAAYWLMIHAFDRPQPVRAPLGLPHPNAPFYGYTARTMRLRDGTEIPTTRDLVRVTGWIATARMAYEAKHVVIRKRDVVPAYQQVIRDEWTGLLEQIDRRCRLGWQYRIPDSVPEYTELCSILRRTPAFENAFLARYVRFLVTELSSGGPVGQRAALQMLERTPYADPAVRQALQHPLAAAEPDIRASARGLIRQLDAQPDPPRATKLS